MTNNLNVVVLQKTAIKINFEIRIKNFHYLVILNIRGSVL